MQKKNKAKSPEIAWEVPNFKWWDANYKSVNQSDVAGEQVKQFVSTFRGTKHGKAIRSLTRNKLYSFVQGSVNRPDGSTPRNIMGELIAGSVPRSGDAIGYRKSDALEELYAESVGHGVAQELTDRGFIHKDDEDYDDRDHLFMALEADSASSKGPYDHSGPSTAIKTVDSILAECSLDTGLDGQYLTWFKEGLEIVRQGYIGKVNRTYSPSADGYLALVRNSNLVSSMRGAPFLKAGNGEAEESFIAWLKWAFQPTRIECIEKPGDVAKMKSKVEFRRIPIGQEEWLTLPTDEKESIVNPKTGKTVYFRKMPTGITVDEVLAMVLCEIEQRKLKLSDIYNIKMMWIFGLSRNQGAPYKIKFDWNGGATIDGRKDDKYRFVQPIGCIAQMFYVLYAHDLVETAPSCPHRVGLQSPSVNAVRMHDLRDSTLKAGLLKLSIDLSGFDYHIVDQMLNLAGCMYASLYDDPMVKDVLLMAGPSICQKILVFPTIPNARGKDYHKFHMWKIPWIQDDGSYNKLRLKQFDGKGSEFAYRLNDDRFRYAASAFYICEKFLTSGHYLTNTMGSDINAAVSTGVIPRVCCRLDAQNLGIDEDVHWEKTWSRCQTVPNLAGGDDTAVNVPIEVYQRLGYIGTCELLSQAYASIKWDVNVAKLSKITYKGTPLLEFLQHHYPQIQDEWWDYQKFVRQFPSLPWTERHSKLHPLATYSTISGRLDSCLTDLNLNFAAGCFSKAARYFSEHSEAALKGTSKPKAYKLALSDVVPKEATGASTDHLGCGILFDLIQKEPETWMATLATVGSDALDDVWTFLVHELELNAPHRVAMAAQLSKIFGKDYRDVNQYVVDADTRFISKIPEFVNLVVRAVDKPFVYPYKPISIGNATGRTAEESKEDAPSDDEPIDEV